MRLRGGALPVIILVITIVLVILASLVVYYMNSQNQLGRTYYSVVSLSYKSLTDQYHSTIDANFGPAVETITWDGKGVVAIAGVGERYRIGGASYWIRFLGIYMFTKTTDELGVCRQASLDRRFYVSPHRHDSEDKVLEISVEDWPYIDLAIRSRWLSIGSYQGNQYSITLTILVTLKHFIASYDYQFNESPAFLGICLNNWNIVDEGSLEVEGYMAFV